MINNCIKTQSIKIIVHHLNKLVPKNIQIKVHEIPEINHIKLNHHLPTYDEKIIEKMIKNGGI